MPPRSAELAALCASSADMLPVKGVLAAPTACLPYIAAEQISAHFVILRQRLINMQHRLGTPLETCSDLEEAREITHTLRNYVQVRWLWSHLSISQLYDERREIVS